MGYNAAMTTMYYSRARDRKLQAIREPKVGMWLVSQAPGTRELDRLARISTWTAIIWKMP